MIRTDKQRTVKKTIRRPKHVRKHPMATVSVETGPVAVPAPEPEPETPKRRKKQRD